MKKEALLKIVSGLAEVVKFHELDTVDSKASELLAELDVQIEKMDDDIDMVDFIESVRLANMVKTAR